MLDTPQNSQPWPDLAIAPVELERSCGLEISQQFIGGLWLGSLRHTCWRSRRSILTLLSTELMVVILLMMFSLPMGLAMMGTSASAHLNLRRFAVGIVGSASLLYIGRLGWRNRKQRSLHRLQHLLDDVEQFNQVVKSITLIKQLQRLEASSSELAEDHSLFSSLQVTRDHLILGLNLDRQLRQHHAQLLNSPDLLDGLATQIASLQVLQRQSGTSEYGQLFSQLIQISRSVEQELQHFDRE